MTRIDPRLMSDPAQHILASEPSLSNEQRADIWDDFLTAPHARALSARLAARNLPPQVVDLLLEAKRASEPEPSPTSHIETAIKAMSQLDPKLLELAESHPQLLRHYVNTTKSE